MEYPNSSSTTTDLPPKKETMSNKSFAVVLATPILIPIAIAAASMFFMFIGCGWLFVMLTFFGAAASAAIGIAGIIGAYVNLGAGIGAALISLSIGLCALGLTQPIFSISKEFFKGFSILNNVLFDKSKEVIANIKGWAKK